jgi:hypothetical protein
VEVIFKLTHATMQHNTGNTDTTTLQHRQHVVSASAESKSKYNRARSLGTQAMDDTTYTITVHIGKRIGAGGCGWVHMYLPHVHNIL